MKNVKDFHKELKNKLKLSIKSLKDNDKHLFEVEVNERSITHKLAEYLQSHFKDSKYRVDCEYNRKGSAPKYIMDGGDKVRQDDTEARTIFPDIIIHERGKSGDNLLVIEIKKDATSKERLNDIKKIKSIKRDLNYKFGVFINVILQKKDCDFEFI